MELSVEAEQEWDRVKGDVVVPLWINFYNNNILIFILTPAFNIAF